MSVDLDNEPPRRNKALQAALEYHDAHGLNPLAAAVRTKTPIGEWRRWQRERRPRRDVEVSFSGGPRNIWVPTGALAPGRLIVLDCDSDEAIEFWREKLGDTLDGTACSQTGRGLQFMFRAPAGEPIPGVDGRKRPGELDWELKGDGQGVILPPSVHPTGVSYTWVREMAHRADAPDVLLEATKRGEDGAEEGLTGERSKLVELLRAPAVAGGRNNWLAQVAGHYAKWIPHRDAYEFLVHAAAQLCRPPLDDDDPEAPDELSKLVESVWRTEQDKRTGMPEPPVEDEAETWQTNVLEPKQETGHLASGGDRIFVPVKRGDGTVLREWLDADLRVLGVIAGEVDRSYLVEVRKPGDVPRTAVLPSATLAATRDLNTWLARYGVSATPPANMQPRIEAGRGERLLRYLEAQDAPEARVIQHIGIPIEHGVHDFITHDEVIRAAGAIAHETVRPDPAVKEWAPYRYGFAPLEEAQAVLRRVMTFHEETAAAVFGAWWAAVLLKPLIAERASQFPIIGLEAPSESGKTTGFFQMMHRLSGYDGPQMNPTRAALRDYLTAHTAGYVWVDDLDALGDREELLRQVPVGGSLVKKSGDHHGQTAAVMRGALAISGENLGLGGQKALIDRILLVDVPSPKERMSRDGSRSQWEEIVEFRSDHPDLTAYSGTLVRRALEWADRVAELSTWKTSAGRFGDKMAVVRFGARLLAHLAGADEGWTQRVDVWCDAQDDFGNEDALTRVILPWALAQTEWRSKPMPPDDSHGKVATPALVDEEGVVWFSPRLLSHWWYGYRRGQISARTETEEALARQARALGLGGAAGSARKDFLFIGGGGKARYWRCTPTLSEVVIERSRN